MVRSDVIALYDGRVMTVHHESRCAATWCCIHKPSNHPLNTAPLVWDGEAGMMFRLCGHGLFHPDPDDLVIQLGQAVFVHRVCDGCCDGSGATC